MPYKRAGFHAEASARSSQSVSPFHVSGETNRSCCEPAPFVSAAVVVVAFWLNAISAVHLCTVDTASGLTRNTKVSSAFVLALYGCRNPIDV